MKWIPFKISTILKLLLILSCYSSFSNVREYRDDIFQGNKINYLFKPDSAEFSSFLIIEENIGFGTRFFTNYNFLFSLSNILNPSLSVLFRYEDKVIDFISHKNRFKLFRFFHIITCYNFWNYTEYGVVEHNLSLFTDLRLYVSNVMLFKLYGGPGFKIADLDFFNSSLNKEYFVQLIMSWRISFNFFITKYFHTAFEISNFYFDEQLSFGAFQIEGKNTFYPSKEYGFIFDYGIGFSGTGALAGFPNRFWISVGGLYKQSIR